MAEKFVKDDDYTLSVTQSSREGQWEVSLKKTFNFKAVQLTTVYRERVFEYSSGGYKTGGAGAAGVAVQMIIQNFNDIQAFGEIKLMHQKLIELGGKLPELSDILPILNKKPSPLRPE